jgi:catechol 2,3-dioxygenase-like lactoylglutathione lyase family enzyme
MELKMLFDHIALETSDIQESVRWYLSILDSPSLLYQDETWALIESAGTKIAFVLPQEHPGHIAFRIDSLQHEDSLKILYPNPTWKTHRDGSESFYVRDPSGNIVEFVKYES